MFKPEWLDFAWSSLHITLVGLWVTSETCFLVTDITSVVQCSQFIVNVVPNIDVAPCMILYTVKYCGQARLNVYFTRHALVPAGYPWALDETNMGSIWFLMGSVWV